MLQQRNSLFEVMIMTHFILKSVSVQLSHWNLDSAAGPVETESTNFGLCKGQLISKCPYEKSFWTKYQRKYYCPGSLLFQG